MSIRLLFGHEFLNHLLHIRVSSSCPDLLESTLDCCIFLHLSFHAFLEESCPGLLDEHICPLFNLILIFTFIGSHLSDISLSLCSTESLLKSFLFVDDRLLKGFNTFLTFLILVIDVLHQLVELELRLKLFLSGCHLLFILLIVDGLL